MSRIAYLINQYPKVSHSFVRREVHALEAAGLTVERFAVRGWSDPVVDAQDQQEQTRTRYLLQGGLVALVPAVMAALLRTPGRFVRAALQTWRLAQRSDRAWLVHWVYLAEACLLKQWLHASGATHLHAHFGTNSAELALLCHALGGPSYSFTVHGPEEFDKPAALHLLDKMMAAQFVVAISSYGRSQLFRSLPHTLWHKVKVVHCGLDKAFHERLAVSVPATPRLVCVGRLCEQKGQLLLVQAAALLQARGLVFEIVLAGDGEMRREIELEVARHGLHRHIRITGWISSADVRAELLAARALVLPSFAEGLPVVIMEAMALRRPVLSTYVAGIPELVLNGETGWLFPAGDMEALANALAACLAAPAAQLDEMGVAGRERVLARHDVDTEAAKLIGLFAGRGQPGGQG